MTKLEIYFESHWRPWKDFKLGVVSSNQVFERSHCGAAVWRRGRNEGKEITQEVIAVISVRSGLKIRKTVMVCEPGRKLETVWIQILASHFLAV